jgi:hypothetical protein
MAQKAAVREPFPARRGISPAADEFGRLPRSRETVATAAGEPSDAFYGGGVAEPLK